MPGSWCFLIAGVLYTKYAVRYFELIQIYYGMDANLLECHTHMNQV